MCLYATSKKVRVAKEDIICYKFMIEHSEGKYRWMSSPYRGMAYKEGQAYELAEKLNLLDFSEIVKVYPYKVEEGFHSFVNLSDALFFRNDFEVRFPRLSVSQHTYVIVKCIIPKGTAYVEGLFLDWGNKFHSYCSEKIICEGKIENE